MLKLKRFWFEFDDNNTSFSIRCCGVTAWNYADALNIVQNKLFETEIMPLIRHCVEDVDVTTLDKGHVLPNMAPPNLRGIWYPLGYTY